MPVSTPTSTVCPRCEAPIRGEFRFCPECAYRIQPGPRSRPEPPGRADRRFPLPLALVLAAVVIAAFFAGRELFRDPEPGPGVEDQVLRVADIADHLVYLPPGPAVIDVSELRWEPLAEEEAQRQIAQSLPLEDAARFARAAQENPALLSSYSRLLARWMTAIEDVLDDTGKPFPRPVQTRPFHLLCHEVTSGQYAEFLADALARPGALRSESLRMLWSPDPKDDRRDQQFLAESYLEYWWQAVSGHAREAALQRWREGTAPPEEMPRPPWLRLPLEPGHGARLLVPPAWVTQLGPPDEFAYALVGDPNWPVTEISWFDAEAFALWASARLGMSLRLPNELEWQRAFHRGNPYRSPDEPGWRYPWGRERRDWACNNLNYWQRYMNRQAPQLLSVLTLFPGDEAFRLEGLLYSMAGNAAEWLANATYRSDGDGPLLADDTEEFFDRPYRARRGGGSFRLGISDCALDAMITRPKGERAVDAGFRLLVRDI